MTKNKGPHYIFDNGRCSIKLNVRSEHQRIRTGMEIRQIEYRREETRGIDEIDTEPVVNYKAQLMNDISSPTSSPS